MSNPLTGKAKIALARMIENQPVEASGAAQGDLATPTPLFALGERPWAATPRGAGRAEDHLPLGVRPSGLFGMPEAGL